MSILLVLFLTTINAVSTLQVQDSVETTTIFENNESNCVTNKGQVGKCMEFAECFPILAEEYKNATVAADYVDGLYEEVMRTSKSEMCTGESIVCCMVSESSINSDEVSLYDDNEERNNTAENSSNIFPSICGQSGNGGGGGSGSGSGPYSNIGYEAQTTSKITGGRNAANGQFPWMVAIFGKNGKLMCGGSLINNNFILTASHCFATFNSRDIPHLKVHIGDYDIKRTSDGPHETRRISKIILHKGFDIKTYHNDVALLKLDSPVKFTLGDIQPICLPSPNYNVRQVEKRDIIVTGWGRDRQWGYDASILRMVEMPMWDFQECQRVFNVFAPNRLLPSMNICAGDGRRNKDACIGDSGGPLIYNIGSRWTQLGIVSWGKGCGSFPGVYTAVQGHLSWIEKQIRTR